jgi:hypothetical protein
MAHEYPPTWSPENPYPNGKKQIWPEFGQSYDGGDWDMFGRLSARFQHRPDMANEYALDYLFAQVNRNLAELNLPQWPRAEFVESFESALEGYLDDIVDDKAARAEHKRGREKARLQLRVRQVGTSSEPMHGGRRPGDQSARVALISETLGVNRRRAYDIDSRGTGVFADRQKLSAAFANDPDRCAPANWDLAFGSKWGRPGTKSFGEYVDAHRFEGDTLSQLAGLYDDGRLADNFREFRGFTSVMVSVGIDLAATQWLWDSWQQWRKGRG